MKEPSAIERQLPPSTSEDPRDPLDRIAEEFLTCYRRGERPSIEEFAQRHPELAAEIRDVFPTLAAMEEAGLPGNSSDALAAGPVSGGAVPAQLGDYRILREVGRGGMGIVYEAFQESLGRHVALKVLPFSVLNSASAVERFQREAKAAARLHHTNIVPVFGVGECEGLHYYAMQFIQGHSLDAVLQEVRRLRDPGGAHVGRWEDQPNTQVASSLLQDAFGPETTSAHPRAAGAPPAREEGPDVEKVSGTSTPMFSGSGAGDVYHRGVAHLGAQAADALAYAHAHGVLHRDIKPSNLLVDTQGTVWLTDFGLAKADDGATLTRSNEVMGTLRYLPPERLDGRCDPRGDVYSLGVTLYEMLALRPAFPVGDPIHLLDRIRHEEPPRLRQLDRSIPADLETIILKAMAKDAAHRYATAGELAEDLRRFLADRPIRARRITATERAWRWCRRNPALATAGGLAVIALLTTAFVAVLFALHQTEAAATLRAEQTKTTAALQEAQTQRAMLVQHQGLTWYEQGQVNRALPFLARGLELVPPGEDDLQRQMRADLALWHRQVLPLRHVLAHVRFVEVAALSPDGQVLATGGTNGLVRLWDTRTGQQLGAVEHTGIVPCLTFSPDSRFLASGSHDRTVRIWDVSNRQPVGAVLTHPEAVFAVHFSPDGRRLMTGGRDCKVRIWDPVTGHLIGMPLDNAEDAITVLALSPDGSKLAVASWSGKIRIWNVADGPTVGPLLRHQAEIETVAFSRDGLWLLTASRDQTARLWNAITGQPLGPPLTHMGPVRAAQFSPSGRLVMTASMDGTVRLWETTTGRPVGEPLRHSSAVHTAVFSSDGSLILTGCSDQTVRLWMTETGKQLGHSLPARGEVTWVAFSPDDRSLLGGGHGEVRLWEAALPRRAFQRLPQSDWVAGMAYSPNGKLFVTASGDTVTARGEVRFWDSTSLQPEGSPLAHALPVLAVAISPDGKLLVTGSGHPLVGKGETRVYDLATRQLVRPPQAHTGAIQAVAFSPDGKSFLTGGREHAAHLWETATGRLLRTFHQGEREVCAVAFHPDGSWVATGGEDRTVRVWQTATGEPVGPPLPHGGWVLAVAFSPDGRLLLTAGEDKTARLFSAGTNLEVRRLLPHQNWIRTAAFSPDGQTLITTSADQTARLWEAATGKPLGAPLRHHNWVLAAAFSPDGQALLTGGADRMVHHWEARPAPLEGAADRVRLWTQVLTGLEVDPGGLIHVLDAATWQERRRQLMDEEGPPTRIEEERGPLLTAEQRREWHQREASAAAADDQWKHQHFPALLYHLERILETKPAPGRWHLYRGRAHAGLGQWKHALEDYAQVVAARPKEFGFVCDYTALLVWTGELPAYHRFFDSFLERHFEQSKDPWVASHLVRIGGQAAQPTANAQRLVQAAERLLAAQPGRVWNHHMAALVYYRAGQFEQAIHHSHESLNADAQWCPGLNWLVLALAHHQLGRTNEARRWWEKAVGWAERLHREKHPALGIALPLHPHDWMTYELLRREAERLFAPGKP